MTCHCTHHADEHHPMSAGPCINLECECERFRDTSPRHPQDFPELAEIVDVTTGHHWTVLKQRKGTTELRQKGSILPVKDYGERSPRFVLAADYYDLPTPRGTTDDRNSPRIEAHEAEIPAFDPNCGLCGRDIVLDPFHQCEPTVKRAALWEPPAETFRTETEHNGWRAEQARLLDAPKKAPPVPANQGVLL